MEDNNRSCIVIPARFKSSRFPGKPLAKISGKEMILWVADLSSKAVGKSNVFIATDDERISNVVRDNGYKFILTSDKAETGTDRISEACKDLNYEIIVNVQGDEPLVLPSDIKKCIKLKLDNMDKIVNGFSWVNDIKIAKDINIPKVITNEKNELIYMSRSILPASKDPQKIPKRFKKQVCIYALTKEELFLFKSFGRKSYLESYEDIEILRFLEFQKTILMYECKGESLAVDIPSDINKIESFLTKKDAKN